MQCIRNFVVCASWTVLGVLGVSASANAACATLPGTWYFYDMEGQSPNIQTKYSNVVVGPALNNKQQIESFSFTKTNKGYDNNTSTVIKCVLTVKAGGNMTAPCTAYMPDKTQNTTISGKLTLSACNLAGTINVNGDPTPVVIQGAHLNGNIGAGIATQGTAFHQFTLVRQ